MSSTLVHKMNSQWKFQVPEHTLIAYEESDWIDPNNCEKCEPRSGVFVFTDDDGYIIHFGATTPQKMAREINLAMLSEKTRGATQMKMFYTANDDDARVLVRDFINTIAV